jgi:hypothetical protein
MERGRQEGEDWIVRREDFLEKESLGLFTLSID